MTQQRQKQWATTLALIVGIALMGPSAARGQKLRVAYTAFAGTFTVLWVGADSGLYKKYGADMELLYIGSSTKAVQALLGGDIDIVYSAAGAVVDANLAGADLSMIGCQYDTGQTSFFTTTSIASIGDLKGKARWRHPLRRIFRLRRAPCAEKTSACSRSKMSRFCNWAAPRKSSPACRTNLVQGGSISMPLTLNARKLGFRELMTTEAIGLPFDYGCFIVKGSQVRNKREELKKVLRATIAAYDLAIADPAFAKRTIGKYTRTNDDESLEATYKENVKDYALRVPYVSLAGLTSILDFRAESAAEVKKLSLEKMYDNSLLQEIQKESTPSK